MKRALFTVGGGVLVVVVAASWLASQASLHAASSADPLRGFDFSVTRDGIWYDGKAETCVYDGTRDIYGESRAFKAIVHTNKERYSSKTKTKNDRGAREVFKHHVIEVIPTENYDYKMSTMVYVDGDDLSPVKIDMGSHEDCGATFKQFIYEKGELSAHQFSYFPNEGHREASNKVSGFAFQDSLSVVLRAYPFDSPRDVPLKLLADQTTTKWSPMSPTDGYAVRYGGQGRGASSARFTQGRGCA